MATLSGLAAATAGSGAAGCGPIGVDGDPSPIAGLDGGETPPTSSSDAPPRWPTERTAMPPCAAARPVFALPDVSPPHGSVAFRPDFFLHPTGYDVRIDIRVLNPASGKIDPNATGTLSFELPDGVILSAPVDVVAGKAEAVVRFLAVGTFRIVASLSDGRTGSVELAAYATQLPVWEIAVDETGLAAMLAAPSESHSVDAQLAVEGSRYATTLELHGGAARDYPKKSFRLELGPGLQFPDGTDHLILRSEWGDKSLLRNYLSSELLRNATWVPTYRTEHVHLRINQRYYGVMVHAERVDKDWLRNRGLRSTGSLYEPDPPREVNVPGGNLTPLERRDLYFSVYQHHAGNIEYDDLIEFIERTLTLPNSEWEATVSSQVDVNEYLAWLAVMAVIQNHDHIRKNYYLYRDPVGDARWHVFPWDLDLTWGHLWTEAKDVLDETLFAHESLFFGEQVPEHGGFQNQLMTRILQIGVYRARFVEFVRHITMDAFTEAFVSERIENVLCRATPDVLADTKKRATNDEYLARVDELVAYLRERRAYIDSQP